MKQLIILTIVAILMVGVVVFLFTRDKGETTMLSPTPSPASSPVSEESLLPLPTVSEVVVNYSDSGYSPIDVKIKKGDTVVFDNNSSKMMWTASAVHPTHKAYPGSDIAKCETPAQASIFDTCGGYAPDELWEFKFNESGTWKYHNHLQPNHAGTVIVE